MESKTMLVAKARAARVLYFRAENAFLDYSKRHPTTFPLDLADAMHARWAELSAATRAANAADE